MNKILILSIVFLSLLGFTSCNQEELETYSGADNIYFSPALVAYVKNTLGGGTIVADSTEFSFSLDNASVTETIYKIPIAVQGKTSSNDRKVKVTIDPSSTAIEGTHFTLPETIIIPAGKQRDTIAVTIFRTPDMKLNTFSLVLNLEENESFATNFKTKVTNVLTQKTMSFIRFKLSFNDKSGPPKGWYTGYYGVFSTKKFFLMCDLMQLDPKIFNQSPGSPGITIPEQGYHRDFMKRYLNDQKASGNTIYEEDGTEMLFP